MPFYTDQAILFFSGFAALVGAAIFQDEQPAKWGTAFAAVEASALAILNMVA